MLKVAMEYILPQSAGGWSKHLEKVEVILLWIYDLSLP